MSYGDYLTLLNVVSRSSILIVMKALAKLHLKSEPVNTPRDYDGLGIWRVGEAGIYFSC